MKKYIMIFLLAGLLIIVYQNGVRVGRDLAEKEMSVENCELNTDLEMMRRGYVPTGEYCGMEDLGEMDYYLFCDTQLHKGVSGYEGKPTIINHNTQTIEEARELYQRFKEQLPLEDEKEKNRKSDGDEDERRLME